MVRFSKQFLYAGGSLIALLIFSCGTTSAQDAATAQTPAQQQKKWEVLVQPYAMFPNINGTVGLGELPEASVNANPGDIFSHLQMGAMLYLEAHKGDWAITSDVLYMNLKQDLKPGKVVKSGELTAKQFAWELAGLRKFSTWFEAGAGIRINSLNAGVDMELLGVGESTFRSASSTKTWVDPILIARIKTPTKGKFSGQLRTDIGGFGIGSKFAWQVQLDAVYKVSKLFDLGLGYRAISVNYEKGSGSDKFLYDTRTFGPVLRLGFNL